MKLGHQHRQVHARPVRAASWVGRARQRARESRGIAIVEAAFVTPVFFILVLGILEVGLAMNDYLALSSTVRAGTRAASASGNDAKADLYTVLGISRESSAIDKGNIKMIVIYKPNKFGDEPSAVCRGGTPQPGLCNVYTPADFNRAAIQVKEETEALAEGRAVNPAKITFGCGPTSPDKDWCPTTRNVRLSNPAIPGYAGPDYVGVWMRVEHPTISKVMGDMTFEDHSVIRLEPRSE